MRSAEGAVQQCAGLSPRQSCRRPYYLWGGCRFFFEAAKYKWPPGIFFRNAYEDFMTFYEILKLITASGASYKSKVEVLEAHFF